VINCGSSTKIAAFSVESHAHLAQLLFRPCLKLREPINRLALVSSTTVALPSMRNGSMATPKPKVALKAAKGGFRTCGQSSLTRNDPGCVKRPSML
jgi:hypothetical protein